MGEAAGRPGLDLAAVARWLDDERPGLRDGDLTAALIEGGRSNLTYTLDDDTHHWVLRRPPMGHVLATAHDMVRELRVVGGLAGGPVPVPAPVAGCTDPGVIGAPFAVMQRVAGRVVRTRSDLLAVELVAREPLAHLLIDTLAALHGVDADAVGLGDFGRPEGFVGRQVRRWGAQLAASRSREVTGIDDLHAALSAAVPTAQRNAIVHGDYRLDNVLLGPDHHITAVLDWEMATLGDPLTDLGLLLVYWGGTDRAGLGSVADAPGSVQGYPGGDALAQRYAAATGLDLTALPWYVAFGYFKLAVVLEGIHYRFTQGQTLGAGFDIIGDVVPGLVAAGHTALRT